MKNFVIVTLIALAAYEAIAAFVAYWSGAMGSPIPFGQRFLSCQAWPWLLLKLFVS